MADWRSDYHGIPPADDENDYVWNRLTRRWEIHFYESEVDEDAVERAEFRRLKRIEWDHYHPGEPCPESELER